MKVMILLSFAQSIFGSVSANVDLRGCQHVLATGEAALVSYTTDTTI